MVFPLDRLANPKDLKAIARTLGFGSVRTSATRARVLLWTAPTCDLPPCQVCRTIGLAVSLRKVTEQARRMWHFVLAWIQVWCKEAGASQSPTPLREFMDLRCGYLVVRRKETSQPVSSTFRESNRKVSLFEGLCLRRRVPDIAKQTSTRRPKQLETWSRHAMTGLPMRLS